MAFKFARIGWPNIGPAAAGPAGPAPTALHKASQWLLQGNLAIPACGIVFNHMYGIIFCGLTGQ